ncbi:MULTISPECIES: hypothetical protein [Burkholderia]|uniref:hypothetical protein n=1 Tax=Burkholderia TaxID=32008 RepID=UPI000DACEE7F|nr:MULTISPECIES: hypothetical protein [Burkholderia]MDP9548282.1 hypothetical protein [Burkholderia cepacia]MBR8392556.1 hypothetical protein [Burkholderia cenocepacia]MBR8469398.1 hypothetical protein [Burkholderia cenocepacia]MBR8488598.1 hypothetical protein [Burkholderia cenocepacia]MDN7619866.1 hypothetical protein [Burkholderia cenocepacia]
MKIKFDDRMTMTPDQSQQIEELLLTWYRWQIRQSHAEQLAHFYRPEDRTCRGYETPMSDVELDEQAEQWVEDQQAEQIQLCIDLLPAEQRAAISVSMRNKECGRDVWSNTRAGDQHASYQAGKAALLPMLVAKHLIKIGEAA